MLLTSWSALSGAEFRVGDQPDRALTQRVLSVQQAARLTDVDHRVLDGRGLRVGKRRKLEHPAEPWIRNRCRDRSLDCLGECFDGIQRECAGHTDAESRQESTSADSSSLDGGFVI
jgi:hypothetical protein